jgi:hypothetical protein
MPVPSSADSAFNKKKETTGHRDMGAVPGVFNAIWRAYVHHVLATLAGDPLIVMP